MIILSRTKVILLLAAAVGALALGVAYREPLGAWLTGRPPATMTAADGEHAGHEMAAERRVLYWYDPMHPQYRSDKPGIAPDCNMALVPKYADEAEVASALAPGTVQLSPAKQQLIGVRTATVAAENVTQTLRAVGLVEVDETRVAHVHTKVSGWVRRVFADFTWRHVEKGAPLFTLYSPELVSAQQEYLIARRAQAQLGGGPYAQAAQGSEALLAAARQRLKLWDVTDAQIAELEERGAPQEELTIYSPVSGHVIERRVFPNQQVTPESDLYTIVDHSRVWVQAQLYEHQFAAVRLGQPAALTVAAFPGRVFAGRVAFMPPHLDMMTRTLPVRLEFENSDLALKPGMYGNVEITQGLGRQLVVPREAVLDTGARQIVFVAHPGGYFEPREIRAGGRAGDRVIVLAGVRAGETIVTSGNFLIDSESRLQTAVGGMQHESHAGAPQPAGAK